MICLSIIDNVIVAGWQGRRLGSRGGICGHFQGYFETCEFCMCLSVVWRMRGGWCEYSCICKKVPQIPWTSP